MSEGKQEIRGLLIAGTLAILGTIIGGVVNGIVNARTAEQKFQSDLIIKALDPPEEANRISNLRFLLKAGLVTNKGLRAGLEKVLEDPARDIPQFKTAQQVVASSRFQRIGGDTSKYTDVTVLACSAKREDSTAGKLLSDVIKRLASAERIGRITPGIADDFSLHGSIALEGRTVIAVDPGHPELADAKRIGVLLKDIAGLPPVEQRYLPPSNASPWRIEVIICPK